MNNPGKNFDQFMYAAMVSRARIEYLWSGQANDDTAEAEEAAPTQPDAPAFDPEMLKKLARKAASGGAEEMSASAPARTLSHASAPNRFAGFSKEVIEAAKALERPPQSSSTSTGGGDSSSSLPAAFRKKTTNAVLQQTPGVPLAFLKRQAPVQTAKVTDMIAKAPENFIGDWKGGSSEAPEDASKRSLEDMKRSFQERVDQAQQALDKAQSTGGDKDPQNGGQFKPVYDDDGAAERKNVASAAVKNSAAVQNIVSLRMEQAQKAVEATKSFHASAPEPKIAEPKQRKKTKWADDADNARSQEDNAGDVADRTFAEASSRPSGGHETRSSGSSAIPSLSRRELAALARGDPNPDAPALGELRAPGKADKFSDDRYGKTGAQVVRESRNRAMGRRSRSRDRDRHKRARSPSTSPERASKRLFTSKPSYRLTGSTFTSAPEKTEDSKREEKASSFSSKPPDLQGRQDLPDWMKDLAEPAAPAQPKLGKKYLHMPRIMIEVLTHNGGEAVRACEQRSQCQIRVETMIEEPVGIVSVNGNVSAGESLIRETLANKGLDLPPQDGLVMPYAPPKAAGSMNQQDIQIPDGLVKHFLGHKGANMKALHAELDRRHGGARTVSIQILPSILPGGFRRIQITGANRLEAQQLVMQHIDDVKREQSAFGDTRGGVQVTPQSQALPAQQVGIRI